jgi:hypothetical protein
MAPETLDKISILVKESMLSYPGLYPTRFSVLLEIWGNSGNFVWTTNGELVRSYVDERSVDEMNYSDLDDRQHQIETERYDSGLRTGWLNEIKIERMERALRAANIDLYASTDLTVYHQADRIISIFGSCSYSNLFKVPENATEEFRQAAMDFIDDLCPMLYLASQANTDGGLREKLIAQKREIFGPEAYDEREANFARITDELVKELMAERERAS